MPWTPAEALKHTPLATSPALRNLWARTANKRQAAGDAAAIRQANAAVAQALEREARIKQHARYGGWHRGTVAPCMRT
jgi:hypothetical protein